MGLRFSVVNFNIAEHWSSLFMRDHRLKTKDLFQDMPRDFAPEKKIQGLKIKSSPVAPSRNQRTNNLVNIFHV